MRMCMNVIGQRLLEKCHKCLAHRAGGEHNYLKTEYVYIKGGKT